MLNYKRTGQEISGHRSDGVMNANFKFLVQIVVSIYRGLQERDTKFCSYM